MKPVAALAALCLCACSGDSPAQRGRRAGAALGLSVARSVVNRETIRTPHRCGRFELAQRTGTVAFAGHALRFEGWSGLVEDVPPSLTIGAVGDARTSRALSITAAAAKVFAAEKVDIVISLGGIAESGQDLQKTLGAMCSDDWLLVALPGDREDLEAHRAAVEALKTGGCAIADGSRLRTLRWADIMVATLPGGSQPSELVAATRGCVHTQADAAMIAGTLGQHDGYRVLASYVPPRQTGTAGSDLVDGVHMGSRALATALNGASPDLVLHAQADRGSYEAAGSQRRGSDSHVYLATGALEPLPEPAGPSTGYALTIRIGKSETQWHRHALRASE